jgi:hypothetical protein
MTEEKWLSGDEANPHLLYIREHASVRKLRLVGAAYVRWLYSLPAFRNARPCADLIERLADERMNRDRIEYEAYGLPGESWELSKLLCPDDRAGTELSRQLFTAAAVLYEGAEDYRPVHQRMIRTLHEVFGNPFRPVTFDPRWRTSDVLGLARAIYEDRAFDRLPILADALMDTGCADEQILDHCRGDGSHVRGCWVVDLVLGKE